MSQNLYNWTGKTELNEINNTGMSDISYFQPIMCEHQNF